MGYRWGEIRGLAPNCRLAGDLSIGMELNLTVHIRTVRADSGTSQEKMRDFADFRQITTNLCKNA
jgi:hypothetical protein